MRSTKQEIQIREFQELESAEPLRRGSVPAGFSREEISPFIRHFSSQVKKCLLIVKGASPRRDRRGPGFWRANFTLQLRAKRIPRAAKVSINTGANDIQSG